MRKSWKAESRARKQDVRKDCRLSEYVNAQAANRKTAAGLSTCKRSFQDFEIFHGEKGYLGEYSDTNEHFHNGRKIVAAL